MCGYAVKKVSISRFSAKIADNMCSGVGRILLIDVRKSPSNRCSESSLVPIV